MKRVERQIEFEKARAALPPEQRHWAYEPPPEKVDELARQHGGAKTCSSR